MQEYISFVTYLIGVIKGVIEIGKLVEIKDEPTKDKLKNPIILEELKKQNGKIFLVQGDNNRIFMGDYDKLKLSKEKEIIDSFSDDKESKKEINIIKKDFYPRLEQFRNSEISDNKISRIMKFLNIELKNILRLSIYVQKLYDLKNTNEAQNVKDDIGFQYGKYGRKLCNLYSTKYIEALIDYTYALYESNENEIKKVINKRIEDLTQEPIYYVHPGHSNVEITSEIMAHIKLKKVFIAVHGAGQNIKKAENIIEVLKDTITESNYDLGEEKQKTFSQTPLYSALINLKQS